MATAPDPKKPKASPKVTLSRLLLLARPERASIILGTIFLLMGSAMNLAFPQGIRFIIDAARSQEVVDAEKKITDGEARLAALKPDDPAAAAHLEEIRLATEQYGAVTSKSKSNDWRVSVLDVSTSGRLTSPGWSWPTRRAMSSARSRSPCGRERRGA